MVTKFRYIGITDERIECEKCGKPNLKSTVVLAILDEDGNEEEITYFGSSCAAKALGVHGGGPRVLQAARAAQAELESQVRHARGMLAAYNLPESGEPSARQVLQAAGMYRDAHVGPNCLWAREVTPEGWIEMVREMLTRHRATLAEGKVVGL